MKVVQTVNGATPTKSPASTSVSDIAYHTIRDRILDGTMAPGQHLREEDLAKFTSTSRTPIREALLRLAREGLVYVAPNKRSYVADFGPEEAAVVFEIRERLESYAAFLAARTITEEEIDNLTSLAEQIEALGGSISAEKLLEFTRLNNRFHVAIVEATRSPQLLLITGPAIVIPLALLKHYVWGESVDMVHSNIQHREIIAALKSRNSEWASAAMVAHINSTRAGRIRHSTAPLAETGAVEVSGRREAKRTSA